MIEGFAISNNSSQSRRPALISRVQPCWFTNSAAIAKQLNPQKGSLCESGSGKECLPDVNGFYPLGSVRSEGVGAGRASAERVHFCGSYTSHVYYSEPIR